MVPPALTLFIGAAVSAWSIFVTSCSSCYPFCPCWLVPSPCFSWTATLIRVFDPAGGGESVLLPTHPVVFRITPKCTSSSSRVWHYSATSLRPFSRPRPYFSAIFNGLGDHRNLVRSASLSWHTTCYTVGLIPETTRPIFMCGRQWLSPCQLAFKVFSWMRNHVGRIRSSSRHLCFGVSGSFPFHRWRLWKVSFSPKQRSTALPRHDTMSCAHFPLRNEPWMRTLHLRR